MKRIGKIRRVDLDSNEFDLRGSGFGSITLRYPEEVEADIKKCFLENITVKVFSDEGSDMIVHFHREPFIQE